MNESKVSSSEEYVEAVGEHPPAEETPMTAPTRPTTFGGKVKRHFRRFWWIHLIVGLLIALLIILLLIYVGSPRIAQHYLNQATLDVSSLNLTDPTPDSFYLVETGVTHNNSPYHPRLDAFNASFRLAGAEHPFQYATFPADHATKVSTGEINQRVNVANQDAFIDYNIAVLMQEEYTLVVQGYTNLHEMAFPVAHVNYNKTVTSKGLNGLQGFDVTNFTIMTKPEADGTNMVGTVYIPNPSVISLEMGNVTFDTFLPAVNGTPKTYIGTTSIDNVTLAPGNNTFPMRSTVNQSAVIGNIVAYHQDGFLPILVTGNSSVYNGQHIPYFEKALQSLTNNVTLNVGAALSAAGLQLSELVKLGDKAAGVIEQFEGAQSGSSSSGGGGTATSATSSSSSSSAAAAPANTANSGSSGSGSGSGSGTNSASSSSSSSASNANANANTNSQSNGGGPSQGIDGISTSGNTLPGSRRRVVRRAALNTQ